MTKAQNRTILTLKQVVAELQLTEDTIYHYLQTGKLKGYKIAGWVWRVKREDLDKFIEEHNNVRADKA